MSSIPASSRSLIAVDIGNSAMKCGLFHLPHSLASLPQAVETVAIPKGEAFFPTALLAHAPSPIRWRVASVQREVEKQLAAWVKEHRPHDDYRTMSHTDFPISIAVDFPERVGKDRLAAAVAGNVLREQHRAAIVIGAGSAVTVDLISPTGVYEGGTILPGFRMGAEALARAADLLPLALVETQAEPPKIPGKSTETAIRGGLFWGAVGAVKEIIAQYAEQYSQPQVFITGGDLQRLAPLTQSNAQFIPRMVLGGIAYSVWKLEA
jgi:type III pantothenate kinase